MQTRLGTLAATALTVALTACGSEPSLPTEGAVSLPVTSRAHHGGRPFATALAQEVTTAPVWSGDPDGAGEALVTINVGQREVCWTLSTSAIRLPATAAHIHEAGMGVRGPVVVGLSAPDASGRSTGCASGVDRELLQRILVNPASFYVNVHTTDFPAGAIRGQLDG